MKLRKKDLKCTQCGYFTNLNECTKTTRSQNIVSLSILAEDICPSWCPMLRRLGGRPKKKHSDKWILEKSLDVLWAKAVKLIAKNRCEVVTDGVYKRCENRGGEGQGHGLNAHHIIGRSNFNVRWDVDNGVAVCVKHHVFSIWSAHQNPFWFLQKILDIRGKVWYDKLNEKALRNGGVAKRTMQELEDIKMDLIGIIKREGG